MDTSEGTLGKTHVHMTLSCYRYLWKISIKMMNYACVVFSSDNFLCITYFARKTTCAAFSASHCFCLEYQIFTTACDIRCFAPYTPSMRFAPENVRQSLDHVTSFIDSWRDFASYKNILVPYWESYILITVYVNTTWKYHSFDARSNAYRDQLVIVLWKVYSVIGISSQWFTCRCWAQCCRKLQLRCFMEYWILPVFREMFLIEIVSFITRLAWRKNLSQIPQSKLWHARGKLCSTKLPISIVLSDMSFNFRHLPWPEQFVLFTTSDLKVCTYITQYCFMVASATLAPCPFPRQKSVTVVHYQCYGAMDSPSFSVWNPSMLWSHRDDIATLSVQLCLFIYNTSNTSRLTVYWMWLWTSTVKCFLHRKEAFL